MADPGELLAKLDDAIAAAPTGWRHRRHPTLVVAAPRILGENGKPIAEVDGTWYAYTRTQCERLRQVILDAARADYQASVEQP